MRRRNVQILFRLTRKEAQALDRKVKASGLNRETFIRKVLEGYTLHEKPDDRFYEALRQLRSMGNNLNQIAAKANSLGLIDSSRYEQEALKWRTFQKEIRETFLNGDKP